MIYFRVMKRVLIGRVAAGAVALVASMLTLAVSNAGAATRTTVVKTTTTTTTTTTSAPQPKPRPKSAHVRIYLADLDYVSHHAVTVPSRLMHVAANVFPYASGQWVTVRAYLNGHLFKSSHLLLWPSKSHAFGHFSLRMSAPGTGTVKVYVRHQGTMKVKSFVEDRSFTVLDENVNFGSTGWMVELIQQRLAALHFYIPQTGVYDEGTGLALDAYHRLLRWGVYQTVDSRTITFLMDGFGQFKVHFPSHGRHAEGDLTDQLLALVNGSQVYQIYPISSGKPSTPTVLGDFQVYSKVPGYLPDGMYYSNFFYGGYAIHGYDPAPDYPASHGCMRLPIVDAISVYNWLNIGNWVDVYYE
jgi:hypothetical protein